MWIYYSFAVTGAVASQRTRLVNDLISGVIWGERRLQTSQISCGIIVNGARHDRRDLEGMRHMGHRVQGLECLDEAQHHELTYQYSRWDTIGLASLLSWPAFALVLKARTCYELVMKGELQDGGVMGRERGEVFISIYSSLYRSPSDWRRSVIRGPMYFTVHTFPKPRTPSRDLPTDSSDENSRPFSTPMLTAKGNRTVST